MVDLLDVGDLAEIYRTTAKGIYGRRCRHPETLPPSFKIGGKVVWLRSTVDAWFKEQERVQTDHGSNHARQEQNVRLDECVR